MKIVVTGGAGYVGSIVCEELARQGHTPLILDNLQQGHRQAVLPEAEFVTGDIGNAADLENVFSRQPIDAVMHMAAETVIEFSMTDPARYFHNNIAAGLNLLDTMRKHSVNKMVFSSSAATYGEPVKAPIEETDPQSPVNSYGETKLMFEKVLAWYGRAYGLKHISFRYFNAAGASERLGEDHRPETHLIPAVLRAALNGTTVKVFGNDYPTRDGSCIRDYVHVRDIARAHVLALDKLDKLAGRAYNLGNGDGYSVLEVIAAAERVCGKKIRTEICSRRPGDPAVLLASSARAKSELGWQPQFAGIDVIIESAWKWMKEHPHRYEE
jgi:UDP-glucose 4-epimerase